MTELSKYDIESRNKYLDEAKSLDFLNGVFCINFYNTDVKRWGPPPKPDDIIPNEVFNEFHQEDFDKALEKCKQLIKDGRLLGDLAYDKSEDGENRFRSEEELFKNKYSEFNNKNISRAFSSGMRDMR